MKKLFLLTSAFLLIGCGTVRSTYVGSQSVSINNVSDPSFNKTGALYFLPKRKITVTASQTPVTATTIATAQTTLDRRVTSVTAAQAAFAAAQTQANDAQAALTNLIVNTDATSEERTRQEQMVRQLQAQVAVRQAALSIANTQRDQASAALAQARSALAINMPTYNINVTLEDPEPDPEYAYRVDLFHNMFRDDELSLNITDRGLLTSSNIVADDQTDEVIVEVAGAGAAVATGLPPVQSLDGGDGGGGGPRAAGASSNQDSSGQNNIDPVKIPTCPFATNVPHTFQRTFDPTEKTELDSAREQLQKCFPFDLTVDAGVSNPKDAAIKNDGRSGQKPINGLIYRATLPHIISIERCAADYALLSPSGERGFVACTSNSNDSRQVAQIKLIGQRYETLAKQLKADIEAVNAAGKPPNDWIIQNDQLADAMKAWRTENGAQSVKQNIQAIRGLDLPSASAPRALAQRLLDIVDNLERDINLTPTSVVREFEPSQSSLVMLPNNGPLSLIPLESRPFTRTVHDVTFQNGILTQWDKEAPSEVLEVVRLPVEILTQIISVPAQIFQLRINRTDNQNGLLASQAAQIQSLTQLSLLQDCVEAVQNGTLEASECLQ